MLRKMTAVLLGVAHLGLSLSGGSLVVICAATFEKCAVEGNGACPSQQGKDCCSHGENQDTRPGCCITIAENAHDGVLPPSVKVPDINLSVWHPATAPLPVELARSLDLPASCNPPDPPGPAGRSLLAWVSRQLV